MRPDPSALISAVVLAGGRSRRMNGRDKAFIELDERPLIRWVIDTLQPQVQTIFIATGSTAARYRSLGSELLTDPLGPGYGPLAGVLACLERAETPYVLTAPCDTPYLPTTLAVRLYEALLQTGADAVTVSDGRRLHGTLSLLDRRLAGNLRRYLEGGQRQVRAWLASIGSQACDFSAEGNAFININSDNDLNAAAALIQTRD